MKTIDRNAAVGAIAEAHPEAIGVLERYGIDYCCGGGTPLADACRQAGVEVDEVIGELEASPPAPVAFDPRTAGIGEIVGYIVESHHAFTRQALERIAPLAAKVLEVHGARHPELARVRELAEALDADLSPHMEKEERVLFPFMVELEQAAAVGRAPRRPPFGTVANPVRMMQFEHDRAGELLAALSTATGGYAPPEDACASYRALYEALAALETDMHAHVHLENNVLFPRAVRLEAELTGAPA